LDTICNASLIFLSLECLHSVGFIGFMYSPG
jgi:hypothetical protein